MAGDRPDLAYRVVADGDRWRWEVMANGRCVAFGFAATSAIARAHAFLFLDRTARTDDVLPPVVTRARR